MFRAFVFVIVASVVYPSLAYPVVVTISNLQKQNLLFMPKGAKEGNFVPSGKSAQIIVLRKNDYHFYYQAGNLSGKLAWGLDAKLNEQVNACLHPVVIHEEDEPGPNLQVCRFSFTKQKGSYKLLLDDRIDTGITKPEFLSTLHDFVGTSNQFFPTDLHKDDLGKQDRYARVSGILRKLAILQPLYNSITAYLEQLPAFVKEAAAHTQHILVFGDQGTGKAPAKMVARDMFAVCSIKNCDDAIVVGDNIYPKAPKRDRKDWEKPFVDKFVKVYLPLWNRFHFPFYVTLGNHDIGVDALWDTDWKYLEGWFRKPLDAQHFIDERISRMQAQRDFTKAPENPSTAGLETRMWNMPEEKYAHMIDQKGMRTFIVSINSNYYPGEIGINGERPDSEPQKNLQRKWLEKTLPEGAKADWRIVYGHHALFSIGRHGVNSGKAGLAANDLKDMLELREALLPVLCENKVDFYLAGHDHHLQLDFIACPEGGPNPGHKIVQILSGAAAKKDAESPWGEWVPLASNAFTEKARYPEFVWGNNLTAADITAGKRVHRMLGFSFLSLKPDRASVEMIESTELGPKLLACYKFDRKEFVGPACEDAEKISSFFLSDTELNIIPPLK